MTFAGLKCNFRKLVGHALNFFPLTRPLYQKLKEARQEIWKQRHAKELLMLETSALKTQLSDIQTKLAIQNTQLNQLEASLKSATAIIVEAADTVWQTDKEELINLKPNIKKATELKNVVVINTTDKIGGAALIASELVRGVEATGLNVDMLVREKQSAQSNVHQLAQEAQDKLLVEAGKAIGQEDFRYHSTKHLLENKYVQKADLVHIHNLHGNYFTPYVLPALTKAKKTIWTLHDLVAALPDVASYFAEDMTARLDPGYTALSEIQRETMSEKRDIYQDCDLQLVAPSQWLKNHLAGSILSQFPAELIYNGVDEKTFKTRNREAVRTKLGLPQEKKILLFLAHGGVGKGRDILSQLLDSLDAEKTALINIGGTDVSHPASMNIGYVSDRDLLVDYYSAADIFVYPSMTDNCPLVVLEAMACSLPVATFATGGIPELVIDGETGLVVERGNSNALIDVVQGLLHDDVKVATMGQAARARVEEKFTLEMMVKKYIDLYNKFFK